MIRAELDCDRLLLNLKAMTLLGIAAVLSVGAVLLSSVDFVFNVVRKLGPDVLSYSAVLVAVGAVSLLVAMWLYWLKCDGSSRRAKTFWFLVLLIGFSLGAIPYYLFVYVPAVRHKIRNLKREAK